MRTTAWNGSVGKATGCLVKELIWLRRWNVGCTLLRPR